MICSRIQFVVLIKAMSERQEFRLKYSVLRRSIQISGLFGLERSHEI